MTCLPITHQSAILHYSKTKALLLKGSQRVLIMVVILFQIAFKKHQNAMGDRHKKKDTSRYNIYTTSLDRYISQDKTHKAVMDVKILAEVSLIYIHIKT